MRLQGRQESFELLGIRAEILYLSEQVDFSRIESFKEQEVSDRADSCVR